MNPLRKLKTNFLELSEEQRLELVKERRKERLTVKKRTYSRKKKAKKKKTKATPQQDIAAFTKGKSKEEIMELIKKLEKGLD